MQSHNNYREGDIVKIAVTTKEHGTFIVNVHSDDIYLAIYAAKWHVANTEHVPYADIVSVKQVKMGA